VSLLHLQPSECVFVDDLPHNVAAAEAIGMVGVVHTGYEQTADQLAVIFGQDLRVGHGVG
jgi:FMN phosphatase YigB (HAD superfamily)